MPSWYTSQLRTVQIEIIPTLQLGLDNILIKLPGIRQRYPGAGKESDRGGGGELVTGNQ